MYVDSILRMWLNFGERLTEVELGIFASFTRKMLAYSKME